MYKVIGVDGKEHPADLPTLEAWARAGNIAANTPLVDMNTGQRLQAGQLLPLQPLFGMGQNHAPAPPAVPPAPPTYAAPRVAPTGRASDFATPVTRVPWHQSAFWITLSLLFCLPVGLALTWLHPRWTQAAKWALTGGFGFLALMSLLTRSIPPPTIYQPPRGMAGSLISMPPTDPTPLRRMAEPPWAHHAPRATPPKRDAAPDPAIMNAGDRIELFTNSGLAVPSATSFEAYDALVKAQQADDKYGLRELMFAGKAYTIKTKTPAIYLDESVWHGSAEVRITAGPHEGEKMYVPREMIRKANGGTR